MVSHADRPSAAGTLPTRRAVCGAQDIIQPPKIGVREGDGLVVGRPGAHVSDELGLMAGGGQPGRADKNYWTLRPVGGQRPIYAAKRERRRHIVTVAPGDGEVAEGRLGVCGNELLVKHSANLVGCGYVFRAKGQGAQFEQRAFAATAGATDCGDRAVAVERDLANAAQPARAHKLQPGQARMTIGFVHPIVDQATFRYAILFYLYSVYVTT